MHANRDGQYIIMYCDIISLCNHITVVLHLPLYCYAIFMKLGIQ